MPAFARKFGEFVNVDPVTGLDHYEVGANWQTALGKFSLLTTYYD